jgi:protocatechuate 4,5-dioxygenase, alpha chain
LILVNWKFKLQPIVASKRKQTMGTVSPIQTHQHPVSIPGTTLFDGQQAQKGYALNKMCFSFNSADNRAAFQADEQGYMQRYGLNAQQAEAVRRRNVLGLLEAGGNIYYLAKFAGILGLDVQDLGALQTGLSKAEFVKRLVAQAEQPLTLDASPALAPQAPQALV